MLNDIFVKKHYTPPFLPINENDIVMDIGAIIGIFTLFATGKTRNSIYAFEPFLENVDLLNRNIQVNNLNNVVVKRFAVTDKVGKIRLFLSKNVGGYTIIPRDCKEKIKEFIIVPTLDLKNIFKKK